MNADHPRTLSAWTRILSTTEIPVLPGTVNHLRELKEIEDSTDSVDAKTLARAFDADPLMSLKVFAITSQRCAQLGASVPETLTGCILMMGVTPFFEAFSDVLDAKTHLIAHPGAYEGLLSVVTRARRAAHFALDFAIRRQDEDAAILHQAALLHDFGEMLLWCHAPDMAQPMADTLAADHTQRSADVQKTILGVTLNEITHSLLEQWRLPRMLVKCTNDHASKDPQVRSVLLGVQIARHTQHGWDSPHAQAPLHDNVAEVARLLTLSDEAALRMLMAIGE